VDVELGGLKLEGYQVKFAGARRLYKRRVKSDVRKWETRGFDSFMYVAKVGHRAFLSRRVRASWITLKRLEALAS
jgi:hypothetical protein